MMPKKLDRRSLLSGMGAMAVPGLMSSGGDNGGSEWSGRSAPPRRDEAGAGRPNVIVIIADDMRTSDFVALPTIRSIVGDRGTVYPNFILNTPICGPSRATLFTGVLPARHGVLENNDEGTEAWATMEEGPYRRSTIFNIAQKAGYRTCLAGKFLNGAPKKGRISPGFDYWYSTSELDYYDFNLNENGRPVKYDGDAYSTTVLAKHAVDFIAESPVDQPFLLFFAPKAPKGPATPEPKHADAFPEAKATRSPAWNEEDVTDKPESVRRRDTLTPAEIAESDDKARRRLQTMKSVDDAFDLIWREVRRTGRADSTVVMVMTDNGYALGEHLLDGKGRPYDPIIRVTMMASGPGFERGGVDERMASMVDVAPTLAQVMGVSLPQMEGASLLEPWTREYVPIETPGSAQSYWAIRGRNDVYVEYDDGEREYYDLTTDPWELDNLLADWEGHTPRLDPAKARALAGTLEAFRTCSGSSCRGTAPAS